jgi:hypothetical protein
MGRTFPTKSWVRVSRPITGVLPPDAALALAVAC